MHIYIYILELYIPMSMETYNVQSVAIEHLFISIVNLNNKMLI